mgnify:CR=1 FL=1
MNNEVLDNVLSTNVTSLNYVNITDALLSLFFAILFGWLISNAYKYSSQSISGGRQISSSILPLTISVCVIITIVKSSLALSLGLVGALSIVRFRTPIKDPEDLVYLFLAIVTGLGFGANQNTFTAIGVSIILFCLTLRAFYKLKRKNKIKSGYELNINVEWSESKLISIPIIIERISKTCEQISFIRLEKIRSNHNLILQVNLIKENGVQELINDVSQIDPNISLQIYNSNIDF